MESELAKTLRSMSDDHRMVPDFSEKLLDIADAIELQAKELKKANDWINTAVMACNKRGCASMDRRLQDAHDLADQFQQERDAALAEVERLKGELAEASGQVEWLDKSNNLLRTQIEGFK